MIDGPSGSKALPCPACGDERSHVYNTRPQPGGRRRHRECSNCGHRYATVELLDNDRDAIMLEKLRRLPLPLKEAAEAAINAFSRQVS